MRKYPAYKDSGIEWIGEIPSHWKSSPICYVASIDNSGIWGEDEVSEDRLGVLVPTTAQITIEGKWLVDEMSIRYITPEQKDYYICRTGDIVVVKSSGSASSIISGKCGFISEAENERFSFGNFLLRLRPTNYNPKLLYYFLSSHLTKQRIERMVSSTTYPNLKVDEYVKSQVLLPPSDEQRAIADFLDKKTALIDELIGKKRRQIELLTEQRQAVINQAVTKGLDPNVEMKDSGIEWLGKIPKHWELSKVNWCFSLIGSGTTPKSDNADYYDNGSIDWVITGDLNDGILKTTSKKITQKAVDDCSALNLFPKGTLLIAMYGATIGKVAIMDFDGYIIGFLRIGRILSI